MAEGASAYAYNDAVRRIGELEKLNSLLAEQIDRMRPVVDAAVEWLNHSSGDSEITNRLVDEVDQYEQQMAALTREATDGRGDG